MTVTASLFAESPSGGDCDPGGDAGGNYNIDDGFGVGRCFVGGTNINSSTTLDTTLGPLANNGGPTETVALLPGSPAIDDVPLADCPPTDQRGNPGGIPCDIGAYDTDVGVTPQVVTFTSTVPTNATVGGPTYDVHATGGASGNPVVFTVETNQCTISGSTVSFPRTGTCIIDANQAGNSTYASAPQVQQSFTVYAPPTITKVKPGKAKKGKKVTITGTYLADATVKFNGTTAAVTTDTTSEIVTTVPAGATTGTIMVTTAGGTATSPKKFKVT